MGFIRAMFIWGRNGVISSAYYYFMRAIFAFLAVFTFLFAGCSPSRGGDGQELLPAFTPRYAHGFRIDSIAGGGGIVITVINPWQGADSVSRSLTVESPKRRIVAMSSTHVAMLTAIGSAGSLVGVSGARFLSDRRARALPDIGYDTATDYERLLALRPDLVLLYGVNAPSTMERKLDELHIPYIYIGDYLEQSPLGKAEWMVALGFITGHAESALRLVGQIASRYEALRQSVATRKVRPRVMLNSPAAGAWLMPPADSYMAQLIRDAGGEYLGAFNRSNASQSIDIERSLTLASKADYWLNVSATDLAELRRTAHATLAMPAIERRHVFANDRRRTPEGGNDFYESATAQPDKLLQDLISILGGAEPRYYYRRLK